LYIPSRRNIVSAASAPVNLELAGNWSNLQYTCRTRSVAHNDKAIVPRKSTIANELITTASKDGGKACNPAAFHEYCIMEDVLGV
jgi:hypothetical protein